MTDKSSPQGTARKAAGKAGSFIVGSWTLFSPNKVLGLKDDDGKPTKGVHLATAWKELRDRYRIPAAEEARHETFPEALRRLGLSAETVARRRQQLVIEARIFYALCTVFLMAAAYYGSNGYLLSAIAGVCSFSMCFVSAWLKAFRIWQIDCKVLRKLADFYATPSAWLV